jgi:regulator of sigma E protease
LKVGGKMSIFIAILLFGFIVFFHELGHFLFARKSGILVEEFAIGMGPKIVGKKVGDTLYSFRILPLGGYCKMLGEDEVLADKRAFTSKSVWRRILVVIGGPLFNMILAVVVAIIWLLISPTNTTTIEVLSEDFPAYESGVLQPGDIITKVNEHNILSYEEISLYINENGSEPVVITFERDGEGTQTTSITPEYVDYGNGTGAYYIGIGTTEMNNRNVLEVVEYSLREVGFWIKTVPYSLRLLFSGAVNVKEVSGAIGIVAVVSDQYQQSTEYGILTVIHTLCWWLAFLSANIGLMNLLPIPALDGGRLIFLLIEAVRGKPVNQEKEGMVHFVGYILLMSLMVIVLFNDIMKLF